MDAIDKAIKKKYHINNIPAFQKQTWEEFDFVSKSNKVIIFGMGVGADYYFFKYAGLARADGCIDNNRELQGLKIKEVLWEVFDDKYDDIKISSIELLRKFDPKDTVVLITGLKRYESVVDELIQRGFNKFYSLLCMEEKYRSEERHKRVDDCRCFRNKECIYRLYDNEPINRNKVVIYTECDGIGHGKEIAKNLMRYHKNIDIVWFVNHADSIVPKGVRKVLKSNYRAFTYEFFTAKIILTDTFILEDINKRDGQCYIQMKHWGSVTLKTFGYDYAKRRNDVDLIKICDRNSKMLDYVLVGSKFDERTCRSGFGTSGDMIYVGSPRSDVLFKNDKLPVRTEYNISESVKLMLYAPTFRMYSNDWNEMDSVLDLDFEKIKKALEIRFKGEWLILLRQHPALEQRRREISLPSYVVDVSDYCDGEELVAECNAMITDYSSIMFEPAYVGKPVFLLATDKKEYLENERDLLIDYDSLLFQSAGNNEELENNILNFDEEKYRLNLDFFMSGYGVHEDGHAGERAAKFILRIMGRDGLWQKYQ